jgi:hypothetical protein
MRAAVARAFHGAAAPLAWYYAIAVAVPILNGAPLDRSFLEHVAFVLAVPPGVITLVGLLRGLARTTGGGRSSA